MTTKDEMIAEAQGKISERAAAIRRTEIGYLGPFDSPADEVRAESYMSKTYTWQRIALWEAVERLHLSVVGSVPVIGTRLVRRRLARYLITQ